MKISRTAVVIFALVVAANYFPLLGGSIPFPSHLLPPFPAWGGSSNWPPVPEIGDLITSFYPFHSFAARSVRAGSFPLWNPHILAGAPFLANAQSALLYPPNFLYYVLPLPAAWVGSLLIRTFLAAIFTAMFVRGIGGTTTGAIVAGIVYSCCGFMTAWQGQALGDAAIWLPLICYSVVRLRDNPSPQSIAVAGFAFAMPILAGHPETTAHSALVAFALAATVWARDRRFLLYFALAGLLAIGLASIQIIPTLEWLHEMRNQFDVVWPALTMHQAQGWFSRDIISSPNSAGISIPEGAAYAGMMALLLAPLAALHRARRYVVFLIATVIMAMMVAYTIPPVSWLVAHAPYLKAMKNGRFIFVASFGIAALAGLGVSTMEDRETQLIGRKRSYAWLLVIATAIVALVAISRMQLATQIARPFMVRPVFSALLVIAGTALIAGVLSGRIPERLFSTVMIGFTAFELLTFSHGFVGFSASNNIYPSAPVFDFIRKNADPAQFRFIQTGNAYSANIAMIYGFAAADGYEVALQRPRVFAEDLSEDREDGVFFTADKILAAHDRRFDLLNIKYVAVPSGSEEFRRFSAAPDRFSTAFTDGHVSVFENKRVLPRAFLVPASGVQIAPDAQRELSTLHSPEFDPSRHVLLTEQPFRSDLQNAADDGGVVVQDNSPNEYHVQVRSSDNSVLVLSQIFYPGWHATLDGAAIRVFPADYALTGIAIPPGNHDVHFFFDPASFKIGIAITTLTLIVMLFFCARGAAMQSNPPDPKSPSTLQ